MYKKLMILILIFLSINSFNVISFADVEKKKVIIVYDKRHYFSYKRDVIRALEEMMGHYDVNVVEIKQDDYEKREIDKYDYVLVVGINGEFDNKEFIEDLADTDKRIFWMGYGIDSLVNRKDKLRKIDIDISYEFTQLIYKGEKYNLGAKRKINYLSNKDIDVNVLARVSDGLNEYPVVFNIDNFYYIGKLEYDSILAFVLCDVMYDFLEFQNEIDTGFNVYIRIEDVHPYRDCEKLKQIGDYLYSQDIPYMLALIPAYINPKTDYITTISDMPEFAKTIRYLQSRGASVVLHGYTHQRFKGETSGEGYEFWNSELNSPIVKESIDEWLISRIELGLRECVMNGIYPIAFEAPHYAMSQDGYVKLKEVFSTYVGHIQTTDKGFSTTKFPFIIKNTKLFNECIPENIGFVEEDDDFYLYNIQTNLNRLKIVKGSLGGMFFHPFIDIEKLKNAVSFFQRRMVSFYNLKDEYRWVRLDDISIECENGVYTVSYSKEVTEAGFFGKLVGLGTEILLYLVISICLMLAIIFIMFKKLSIRRLFK